MKCDTKTMIKVGVGIGAVLAVAYAMLPAFRALILASAPILLALICPLSMIFMMKSMNACNKESDTKTVQPQAVSVRDKSLAE